MADRLIEIEICSKEMIKGLWPKDSLITFDETRVFIHIDKNAPLLENLRSIQEAAKALSSKNLGNFKLKDNDYYHWDDESVYAFDIGFYSKKNTHFYEADKSTLLAKTLDIIHWVRNTINAPANKLNPVNYFEYLQNLLKITESNVLKINDITDDKEFDFTGIKTVSAGSKIPGKMYEIDYNPSNNDAEEVFIGVVGKGITFDSGGLSLKPSEYMKSMHSDMGGSATVAGAIALAAVKNFPKRIKAYLCCSENMISGSCMKIGDIITYPNGVSVEIANTDAEGRLVLADGLILASKAKYQVDAATLTGAAKVALGRDYNAVLSFNNDLGQKFLESSKETNELSWQLPLESIHKGICRSEVADITNSASGEIPGATSAAVFLSHFVNDSQKWLHIDLSASFQKVANKYYNQGAKGHGVRSLEQYFEKLL